MRVHEFLTLGKVMLSACVYLQSAVVFSHRGYKIPTKGISTLFYFHFDNMLLSRSVNFSNGSNHIISALI
jgi:hypothetical protein